MRALFRWRLTGAANPKRLAVAGLLLLLAPVGAHVSALALSALVAALLSAFALWELWATARPLGARLGSATDARGALVSDLGLLEQQQEGTS